MTTIEYRVYDPTNTDYLGTLGTAYQKSFVDALSSPGVGRFSIDLDDPDAALVQPRRVVRVQVDGTDRFAFFIDDMPRNETGDADSVPSMAVSGPGLSGWLGTGRGGALVYPPRFRTRARNRAFGWHSLDYSRPGADGWFVPNVNHTFGRQEKPQPALPRLKGQPEGWPDRLAQWMTPYQPTYYEDGRVIHSGTTEMLLSRHLPSTGAEEPARIYAVGTNEWDLYFDGERIASGAGFRNVVETDVFLEGRPMALGAHVRHTQTPGFKYDVLAFMLTVVRLRDDGTPGGVLFRTYTPNQQRKPAPTQYWRMLADPTELPGLTPGYIVKKLIDEAKARGTVPSLSKTDAFTSTTDANGQAWTAELSHDFPIATKLSDVLDQVVGLTGVEYTTTPTGQLRLANRIGVARSGSLSPLVAGHASGEGVRATVLLGEGGNGYLERTESSKVAQYGRVEDGATLGTYASRLSLAKPLDRMLATASRVRDERDYVLASTSPQPYIDFGLGDTYPEGRVTQITMTQDDANGAVEWAASLLPEG